MDITGDVHSVDYQTNGLRVGVALAVAPDAHEMSLLLNISGGSVAEIFADDVPDVRSGTDIDSDNCWRVIPLNLGSKLTRSTAADCANSNKISLSWWSQSSGTSGPYAWAYVPAMNIAVDRRNVVENRFVGAPAGPETTLTSAYNLDDPLVLGFHLHNHASFSLLSTKLFATTSDKCVGVAGSDVVSSWNCNPSFKRSTITPTEVESFLPAAYSIYERDGYEATREAMLLVMGALLGFVGAGVYAELQLIAPRRERKPVRS